MGKRIVGEPVSGIVLGVLAIEFTEAFDSVVAAPPTCPSVIFALIGVGVGVGVDLRANNDSKNPFLGVGVIVFTTVGVGVTFTFLKAMSLSERFTRDPNTNKKTNTTMRPRMKEVALLKPLMREL